MKRNQRHPSTGKALKWIDTKYARPFKIKQAIGVAMFAGRAAMTAAKIQTIRNSNADKVTKATAIAQTIVNLYTIKERGNDDS